MSQIWEKKFESLSVDHPLRMIIPENNYFESINDGNSNDIHFNISNNIMWKCYIQRSRNTMNGYFNSMPQSYHNSCYRNQGSCSYVYVASGSHCDGSFGGCGGHDGG